ncbi:conserved hypothetical protein [Theileria orientalis strain Shintoku]|uniref:Uncharacterized protein n=1 Tax=Theileria orientalis strain Shintoku TaxID=869250 RepID=J4C8E8_THEOR|nr:conserved hypothetical protein [Theileria orientalis strain Shintoku]BAM40663.1 conserved hypothetical protein [Theileria orientalis strain Shintoku]|eukprot:XP_009690964.1 conserved hypothetical protein [Theileria orientalis strain Shintoku]
MKTVYTFFSYLFFRFFIQKTICLELNIGKITDYSSGSSKVTVKKTTELQNLYTHKFSNPVLLKNIYNGKEKIYFDPLLVEDQLLLSASVVWSFETPSIIQLNLEQSSVLLINEKESLDVQAIFSKKLVTNIKPRIHSDIDAIVDINLSNIADYNSNNSKVYVTNLKFSEDRFKRYTVRNYNLESTRLGKILYNNTELKTKFENDLERSTESNLDIPYKNNVYSIQVYAYNNFPLLIEFLYTFNKRQFYGYTPEEKWHHVYFPAFHDPSFLDFLYNKLNYYACKNGFKYTIDINQKTDTSDRSYQIDNYCIGSEGVETVVNNLKLPFYIDEEYKNGVYRCFEHTPSNDNKFFIDHLMVGTSLLKLPNTPNVIKCSRVYYQLNLSPYLIVLVDNSDELYYYIYENGVWKEHKKEKNVQFDERFNDNIRTILDKIVPTVQVSDGTIVVLTDYKKSYDKEQINKVIKHSLSSTDLFDNSITVTETTQDKGSCLTKAGYRVYMHDLSGADKFSSQLSEGSRYYFLLYVNNTKINLYQSTNVDKQSSRLVYQKQNNFYVYYYREYSKALLICHNGSSYRPYDLEQYSKKWIHVKEISDCCCKSGDNEVNNKALSNALLNVIELFNLVNPYEQARVTKEYENSSLFFEYTHGGSNYKDTYTIEVCKKLDCSKILKLTNDANDSKSPFDRALVYFNRYDTKHENPLIILLHFRNSDATRYYEPSEIHGSSDADSSKPIVELTKYKNESDFANTLLEKNDTFYNTITYQIDKKDNSYNDKRVIVVDNTSTVVKLSDNGFTKFVHSPTSGNTDKKCFILHRSNILKTWNNSNKTFEPLDKLQNIVYKSVSVYYSINLDMPLLISFLKPDGQNEYYFLGKQGTMTYWNQLDIINYQKLLVEAILRGDNMHDKLTENDNSKLLKLLKQIESLALNTVIVLLDKRNTYDIKEVERRLKSAFRKPKNVQELSESQPDSIVVKRQDNSKLKSLNFECFIQTIIPKGVLDNVDLRIMVPTDDDKYSNIILYKSETKVPYRSKIIFDLNQRENDTFYDAEKHYVFVTRKEFTNPPYFRYSHTCSSCGNLSDGEFTIKFKGLSVNFNNTLPETTQKRIDVYFRKDHPDKFSKVVFHTPEGYNPRYFGYSDFIQYHKNNKLVQLSLLLEFNHDYTDNITPEFRDVLELELPKLQRISYSNTDDLLYKENETDLYVYFHLNFKAPLMLCYDNKAYIPWNKNTYNTEWIQVSSIKGCKCEGENEKPILNAVAYVYGSLNLAEYKTQGIPSVETDRRTNATMPLKLYILSTMNAKRAISTIYNDNTLREITQYPEREIDIYYYTSAYEYVEYSGDLYSNLTIATINNEGLSLVKYYGINIMSFTDGIFVHLIEYFYNPATYDIMVNLYTNTLFIYTFKSNYYNYYDPFTFVGISKIKAFEHSELIDAYFDKVRDLNRTNFFVSYAFNVE